MLIRFNVFGPLQRSLLGEPLDGGVVISFLWIIVYSRFFAGRGNPKHRTYVLSCKGIGREIPPWGMGQARAGEGLCYGTESTEWKRAIWRLQNK